MSFPRYESYKESGIDWLGPVPVRWTVCALNHRYEVLLGKMLDEKRVTGEHLRPYLRNIDVQWGKINTTDLPEMDFKGDDLARYALRQGDLLVCEGGEVGRSAVWEGQLQPCFYQKALHRLRPRSDGRDHPRYLFYVMYAGAKLGVFGGSEGKSTIAHLTAETLRRYQFGFPPFDEQLSIAAFLDRETAKINALVDEQTRLIELLKEKRQAVISHAVTKGLDPNAAMKDSGVEWLGLIPEHWNVMRLKHLTTNIKAGPFGSALTKDMYTARGYRVFGQEQVIPENFAIGDYYISNEKFVELKQYAVSVGDILISCVGTFGKVAIVPSGVEPGIINPRLIRLRCADAVRPEFLATVLRSEILFEQFSELSRGGTMDVINIGTLHQIVLALPPVNEQSIIVEFLRIHNSKVGDLITEAEAAIGLLQERRSALISAAVTGKIDIRGLVPTKAEAA